MMRRVFGVIVGFVVAFLCVQGAELFVHLLYPPPLGADLHNSATLKAFVATLPPGAFLLVLAGWLAGTLIGTFLAAKIGRSPVPAYIVGALLLAGGVGNAVMLPQPVWFDAVALLIFVTIPFTGIAMAKPAQPATA
jgi:hypothetical protein